MAAPATAADIMRPPVTTVEQEGHVAAAAYLMKHAGATALLVLEAWTDLPVGIITEKDIAHAAADGKDVNRTRIRELMTTRPTVIKTTTSVCDTAKVMTSGHFRHLPVVGDAGLVGIVDIIDVCRALLEPAFPGCSPAWASESSARRSLSRASHGVRAPRPPSCGACVPPPPNDRGRPTGHGCHDPRRAGHVCHNPQKGRTKRATPPGACSGRW